MLTKKIQVRKNLNGDKLLELVREEFDKIEDNRVNKVKIEIGDILMSCLALFSLKDPSLLAFDARRSDENMKNIYKIKEVPSDTHMRKILDEVDYTKLGSVFLALFNELQRGKGLEDMAFYEGHYLVSNDGTGFFSSDKIYCENCMEKVSSKTGEVKYYHHFFGSCLVHPNVKEVIPLCPEPIMKQDGTTKNDCERNASKRWLKRFRKDHPYLQVIIIEDALASNAPHIRDLEEYNCKYILGVKKGDHKFLFDYVSSDKCKLETFEYVDQAGVIHKFNFVNQVPLNASNKDLLVNFIEYWEIKQNGKTQHFSWITNIEVKRDNIYKLMRGGRSRWKIENETFNTLKNHGYQFEHNFGHGYKNLSTVFAFIMMIAFLIDQIQQKVCPLFKEAWKKCKTKRAFWEKIRIYFGAFICNSMTEILETIVYGLNKPKIGNLTKFDTS